MIICFEYDNIIYEYIKSFNQLMKSNLLKTLLANGLSTFVIKDKPFFSINPKSLPKKPHAIGFLIILH